MKQEIINPIRTALKRLTLAVPLAAAMWLGAGPSAQAIPTDSLIHYDFDSVIGTTVTNTGSLGSAADGTLTNATSVAGQFGNALSFTGNSSGVITNNTVVIGNAFTFACWVSTTNANGSYRRIILNNYQQSGYLGTNGGGQYLTILKDNFVHSSTSTDTSGGWHHLAMTWDGTNQKFYYDGVLNTTNVPSSRNTTLTERFGFGCNLGRGESWNGKMDDAFVFGRALSLAEIGSLYINAPNTAPVVPTGVAATPVSSGTVSVSWAADANATSRTVSVTNTATTVEQLFNTAAATSYTVSGLTNGTVYDFKVLATNGLGSSAYSSVVSATPALSSAKDILTFLVPGMPDGVISGTNISVLVPFGTDVTTLAPTYSISPFASEDVSFPSGTPRNFSTPQTYTITAEDTSPQIYTVTVTASPDESTMLWNVAGGGAWNTSTLNWKGQVSGESLTFVNGKNAIFDNANGGVITLAAGLLPASTTVSATSGTYTFSGGPLAGTGTLTKSNGGRLKLYSFAPNSNTYSGGTIINSGILQLGDVINGATPGCADPMGSGPVTLNSGATIEFNNASASNALTVNGGTLANYNGWGSTWSGPITLNETLTCNAPNQLTCSGAISGIGGLTKTSGGPLILSGTNSYEGPTTVTSGTLQCNNANAMTGGALSISTGGAKVNLNFTGSKSILSLTLGGVEQTASGTYGSTTSTATFKSGFFIGAGIVTVGDPDFAANITSFGTNVAGSAVVIDPVAANGAAITWYVPFGTVPASLAPAFVMTSGSTCSDQTSEAIPAPGFDSGPVVYTIVSPNGFVTNVYTVTVTVLPDESTLIWNLASGGTWNRTAPNWLGQSSNSTTPYFDGVNVIFNNTVGGTITMDGNLSPLSTTVNAASGTYVFSVAVDGGALTTGSLTKDGAGTLLMAKTNSYAGGTLIKNGTLLLEWPGDGVSHTTLGSGPVTLDGGTLLLSRTDLANDLIVNGGTLVATNGFGNNFSGTITLNATLPCNVDYALVCTNTISGSGGLTKNNGGPLTLSGTNTYAGPTTVNGGTLQCNNVNALGSGALSVSVSATLNLNYAGDHAVASLTLAGVLMPSGTYGSSDPSGRISGTGTVTVASGFSGWASTNAPGQTPGQDYDNDGVDNGMEYFMGETGSAFTAMPGLDETNTVTWTMDPAYVGTYEVQTSPDLSTWTNVDPRPLPVDGNLSYTLPPSLGTRFVRLLVTPAP